MTMVDETAQQSGEAAQGNADASETTANEYKQKGNQCFKDKSYQDAIDWFTKAIDLHPTAPAYSNRAFAHIKLEEYGSAIIDSTEAITLDPAYVKNCAERCSTELMYRCTERIQGYYRRADASMVLGKHKDAVRDFKQAAKGAKSDPDLKRKLLACQKEIQQQRFAKAVSREDNELVTPNLDLDNYHIDASYDGPRMAPRVRPAGAADPKPDNAPEDEYEMTESFLTDMMASFKAQKKIHLRFVMEILISFQNIVKELPSLVDVAIEPEAHITVCGDTHGQFFDLMHIFDLNGTPSVDNPYVFNGDFVDRGSWSVEVILTLMAWKVLEPSCVHLTRGNHEAMSLNKIYGFEGEVKAKYNQKVMDVFRETFCWLPLSYCLNKRILVLHGGLFNQDGVTLDDIRKVDRFREPPDSGIMCDILWSDPQPEPGRAPSKRGCGVQFGPDITKAFLDANGLDLIIRSHEVKEGGYEVAHDGKCVTVFSAPNYCDNMGNKGAFITLKGADMVPHFQQFTAVPHPDMKPMAYADMSMFGGFL